MTADYQTLNTLWERYDERPGRVSAITVLPENITLIAEALVAQGIRASVDFKDQVLTFETPTEILKAQAYSDCIVGHGPDFEVWPRSILRAGWRKYTGEDW